MGGLNPLAMEGAAQKPVWTSASVTTLRGRAPTGVGPPQRASEHGDSQHWPADATCSNVARQHTPAQPLSRGRRVHQQTQVRNSPAKGGSSTTATNLVARSPYANRSPHGHQQLNAHSHTADIHSAAVRHSPTPNRPATPTPNRPPTPTPNRQPPVQTVSWNTDAARVKTATLRTNTHTVPFLDEEQKLRAATGAPTGKSAPRKALQQVQFLQGLYPFSLSKQGAAGALPSGTSRPEAIDLQDFEVQRKRRLACRLEEDDRMYAHLRQQRARIIPESDARLMEV